MLYLGDRHIKKKDISTMTTELRVWKTRDMVVVLTEWKPQRHMMSRLGNILDVKRQKVFLWKDSVDKWQISCER